MPKPAKKEKDEQIGTSVLESTLKRKALETPGRGAPKHPKKDSDDVSISDGEPCSSQDDYLAAIMNKLSALEVLLPLRDDVSHLNDRLSQVESNITALVDEKLSDTLSAVVEKCESKCMEHIKEYDQSVSARLLEQTEKIDFLMREQQIAQSKITVVMQGIPMSASRDCFVSSFGCQQSREICTYRFCKER